MSGWLLSTVWYVAILLLLMSAIALVRPLRRLRLSTRRRAIVTLFCCGVAIALLATITPKPTRLMTPASRLDDFAPAYHYREVHTKHVDVAPERLFAAVKQVTADEIFLFRTFINIRRFGQAGPESILNPPNDTPIIDVATRTTFVLLADAPPRELVVGTIVAAPPMARDPRIGMTPDLYAVLNGPGFVKATMNFLIEPQAGGGSRITTETRVYGTDDSAIRRFTPYWRTIFPGSWILRVTWLNAIAERARQMRG